MSAKTQNKTSGKSGKTKGEGSSLGNAIGLIVVAAICVLALWGLFGQGSPESTARPIPASQTRLPQPSSSATASPVVPTQKPTYTGQPWEYDVATNHHWDPRPGHQHWHQGQPPPEDQRSNTAGAPTITPVTTGMPIQVNPSDGRPDRDGAPWEFDEAAGFHWDPRPGHEHWHQGPPPPEDQRQ